MTDHAIASDLRVCFSGDSFVQGVGDPEYHGWVGRVLRASAPDGRITAFNLGVRRSTSEDVLHRLPAELDARTAPGWDNRLVVSFGANDAVVEDGRPRVDPARTLDNLATLLALCGHRAVRVLVVGPPPVADADPGHLDRLLELAAKQAALCAEHGVPFTDVTAALAADPDWTAEALAGDGAHPGAGGYGRLADLVLAGPWPGWLAG